MVYRGLKKSLDAIKQECNSHKECWSCPFFEEKSGDKNPCLLLDTTGIKFSENIENIFDIWNSK